MHTGLSQKLYECLFDFHGDKFNFEDGDFSHTNVSGKQKLVWKQYSVRSSPLRIIITHRCL